MTNRERILQISYDHKLSHVGSCLTALGIIEEIYAKKKPEEKVVVSSGHAHLAHAVVQESNGAISSAEENIQNWGIHCDRRGGCDSSTGSLGQGLPIAVGMALADRDKNTYVLVSDGEMAEGSCWEALRIAKEQNLTNLKIYLNANGWGAYDPIDIDDLEKRIKAFGFPVEIERTNSDLPFAKGQASHYKVMSEEDYESEK